MHQQFFDIYGQREDLSQLDEYDDEYTITTYHHPHLDK